MTILAGSASFFLFNQNNPHLRLITHVSDAMIKVRGRPIHEPQNNKKNRLSQESQTIGVTFRPRLFPSPHHTCFLLTPNRLRGGAWHLIKPPPSPSLQIAQHDFRYAKQALKMRSSKVMIIYVFFISCSWHMLFQESTTTSNTLYINKNESHIPDWLMAMMRK